MGVCSTVRAYASRGVNQTAQYLGALQLGTLTFGTGVALSMLTGRASIVRRVQCASAASNRSTSRSRDVLKQAATQASLEQADRCSRQPTAAAAGSHLCETESSEAVHLRSPGSLSIPDSAATISGTAVSSSGRVQSRGRQCLSEAAGETRPAGTAATDSIRPASRRRLTQRRRATDGIGSASRRGRLPQSQRDSCTQLHSVIELLASVQQQATFSSSSGSSSTSIGSSSSVIAPACCDSKTTSQHGTLCAALPRPTLENLSFKDSAFSPRDYQVEATQRIVQEWQAGSSVQMVMLPTGTGKTVVFALVARFVAQHYGRVLPEVTPSDAESPMESDNDSRNSENVNLDVAVGQGVKELAVGELGAESGHRSTIGSAVDHSQDASGSALPDASAKAAALRQLLGSPAPASDSAGGTCTQPGGSHSGGTSRGGKRSSSKRGSKGSACVVSQASDQTAGSASCVGAEAPSMPSVACDPGQAQTHAVPFRQGSKDMRVLVLAHRGELLQQAQDKFQLIWPEATVSWVKGTRKEFWGQVVLASVQTAVNCLEQLKSCRFSLVVVDEAHHSVANSYKQVLKGFGFVQEVAADLYKHGDHSGNNPSVDSCDSSWYEDVISGSSSDSSSTNSTSPGTSATRMQAVYSPNTLLVGFTATPYRLRKEDSEQLYEIFQPTYTQNINDMIQRKYLSQIHSRKIFTDTDLKGARSLNGDFTPATLSPLVNSSSRNKLVLHAYLDYCTEPATSSAGSDGPASQGVHAISQNGSSTSSTDTSTSNTNGDASTDAQVTAMAGRRSARKAIGFAVDICHAETLNALFLDAGVKSGVIHSKRPDDENSRMLLALKGGQLDIVWNVEKLTEGFDEPSLNAVLMVRPTRSTGLYTQMLGRALRRWPGKDNCLVLDFTDKHHRADRTVDLRVLLGDDGPYTSLDPPPPASVDRQAKVDSKGRKGGVMSVLGDGIDPLDMAWKQFGSHWMCNLFSMGNVWLVNLAEMGSNQRQMLGLRLHHYKEQDKAAAVAVATESSAGSTAGHSSNDKQLVSGQAGLEGLGDRYVVLHQRNSRDLSPMTWSNGAPSAVQGMTALDAYGAALDYMEVLIRKQQQKAVWSWRKGYKSAGPPAQLRTFKRDAAWRKDAMGAKQINFLQKLKVSYNSNWTKGDASDAIAAALCRQATDKQRAQLQEKLEADEYNELPVPLLSAFAATVGASDDA